MMRSGVVAVAGLSRHPAAAFALWLVSAPLFVFATHSFIHLGCRKACRAASLGVSISCRATRLDVFRWWFCKDNVPASGTSASGESRRVSIAWLSFCNVFWVSIRRSAYLTAATRLRPNLFLSWCGPRSWSGVLVPSSKQRNGHHVSGASRAGKTKRNGEAYPFLFTRFEARPSSRLCKPPGPIFRALWGCEEQELTLLYEREVKYLH